ncbi:phenylalanine--tRNA ligase subunit beta [Kamptonema cortianum]|nr:phenylalanine--tRNA ligase subunit beta [Geitlerinema splendidum]MDK3155930.1 phenylalanine--tRNA ligase subunit beta [Kamptonema cortianum]
MKFTESMLRDFVDTALTAEQIGDLLTMTGFELEEITEVEGEKVFDVNIMANRGDGASVMGMAREVLAKDPSSKPTELFASLANGGENPDVGNRDIWGVISIDIQTPLCNRFACRAFHGLTNGESPDWLKQRLRQIGQRPISLLVDLTNYVMFETGQPLHAFDLDKLAGSRIVVREANAGEIFTTLDEVERKLSAGMVMICDADRAVGIGGVMGGLETEVSSTTTNCLLEAANFNHQSVRKTRTALGLHTEASYRFERYVDPQTVPTALNRFAQLLAECGGPKPVGGIADVYPSPPEPLNLFIRPSRASLLLGMQVSQAQVKDYLGRLGFTVISEEEDKVHVQPPTWRNDVVREEDLVEEVGRIHGYELIPEELPIGSTPVGGTFDFYALVDDIREALLRAGFDQTISHSLRDVHPLDAPGKRTKVRNPHSPEIAYLRNSTLPSLADAAIRNGSQNLHIFEIGQVHGQSGERTCLSILSQGHFEDKHWQQIDTSRADFFSVKGVLKRVAKSLMTELHVEPTSYDERLHPTRQAIVLWGGFQCGTLGQIHPLVAEKCDIPTDTVLAEIDLSALESLTRTSIHQKAISKNPAVRRDIAFTISKQVPFVKIKQAITAVCGDVLELMWLFDVYEGKGVPEGQHSLAIALQLRKLNENFTDEEANQVRDSVVKVLESLGAKLRG